MKYPVTKKLTKQQAEAIQLLYLDVDYKFTYREVADKYNVSTSLIEKIVAGQVHGLSKVTKQVYPESDIPDAPWLRYEERLVVKSLGVCWEYVGSKHQNGGYGKYHDKGVHRLSWEYHNGRTLNAGMYACHHCDNPPCINPDHLYEGTPKDNSQDQVARDRLSKTVFKSNEAHPNARLSDNQIQEIRDYWASGLYFQKEIASMYGVRPNTISRIVNYKRRK